MRILLVLPGLMESGATRLNIDLARCWQAAGQQVVVVVVQSPPPGRPTVPAAGLAVRPGAVGGERLRRVLPRVQAELLRLAARADVVVSGSEVGVGLLTGWLAARVTRRPFVTIVHASPGYMVQQWTPRPLRRVTLATVGRSDAAVCVSAELRSEVTALGVPADRVHHVRNGRDIPALRRRAAQLRAVGATGSPGPLVVAAGRLVPQKGFDLLVRAHAEVRSRGVPHRVRILGDGPQRAELDRLCRELGVAGSVELPGFRADLAPDLVSATVFALPSRHEGTPLVLVEAMASGAPVVAADCSTGVREVLGAGAFGELVPPEDTGALADALERHLRDPARLRQRLAAATAHLDGYGVAETAQGHLDVLARTVEELVGRNGIAHR